MSKLNLKAEAIAAYESAVANPSTDWRAVAELLRAAIPSTRALKLAIELDDSPIGFAPIADYPITRYKTDRVGPTCVVQFADGELCRMSTATLPNKPLNVGRGIRLCGAAWQSRRGRPSRQLRDIVLQMTSNPIMNQDRLKAYCARRLVKSSPAILSCHFERDGEIIATFNPDDCNRLLSGHQTAACGAAPMPRLP